MVLKNYNFGCVVYFTSTELYFKDNNEIDTYLDYYFKDQKGYSFGYYFIKFLAEAWHPEHKCNFSKDIIMNLVKNIEDEKLKFFLYTYSKHYVINKYYKFDYLNEFGKCIVTYYKENPINEKLVNMELKLMKERF